MAFVRVVSLFASCSRLPPIGSKYDVGEMVAVALRSNPDNLCEGLNIPTQKRASRASGRCCKRASIPGKVSLEIERPTSKNEPFPGSRWRIPKPDLKSARLSVL